MGEVVYPDFVTTLDIPVETVLDAAKDLELVVVLGFDKEGRGHYTSSTGDPMRILWLLEQAKCIVMEEGTEE